MDSRFRGNDRLMRVLHIGKFFPPHPGGIERCMADLCAALHEHNVEIAALAHAEPGARGSEHRDPAGFDVTLAACHGRLLYAPLSPGFPLALSRTIRRFRPDILHLHVPNTSAFCALLSPAARRLRWIVHWHADIPLDTRQRLLRAAYGVYRHVETAMLRRADAIVATSEPYRDTSAALAPFRAKTHVIPLGIAPNAPAHTTLPVESIGLRGERETYASWPAEAHPPHPALSTIASDGREEKDSPARPNASIADSAQPSAHSPPLRILAVGRLSYFKGIDVLLRAVAQLPRASLLVIGDGGCREALERLARELRIETRVRFAGRIDMDARGEAILAAAYANADVFCLPSTDRAESFGLVLLEAMRSRRPVVASAIPGSGVGYVVRDGETGLLVPRGDVSALVVALARLADDAALRSRLGAAGEQRWRDEFTLDRTAERVLELYRSVLETAPARAPATPAS
jgi:glycosyltransferase involved in cell wall biosynthesis